MDFARRLRHFPTTFGHYRLKSMYKGEVTLDNHSSRGMTGNTRKSISYQITAATHFLPFSTIFVIFGHGLPGYLDYRDGKHAEIHFLPNNRGNPFSTILTIVYRTTSMTMTGNTRKSIFHHFLPLPAWLPYLSITRNARKPMTANFGQFLQC